MRERLGEAVGELDSVYVQRLYAGTEQHFRQCHTCRRRGKEEYTRCLTRIS